MAAKKKIKKTAKRTSTTSKSSKSTASLPIDSIPTTSLPTASVPTASLPSESSLKTSLVDTPKTKHFDVVIVGGGLVGICLARALAQQPVSIAILEAFEYQTQNQPSFDDRAIALSFGSRRIFEGLGLWEHLQDRVTPIHDIHISEQGKFGVTRINAKEENVPALGYVIAARELGINIVAEIKGQQNLSLYMPAELTGIHMLGSTGGESESAREGKAVLEFDHHGSQDSISASVVIAADGVNSSVRTLLGIATQSSDYKQTAVVSNIRAQIPHNNVAYERFTKNGPLALLPMAGSDLSLVWTQSPETLTSVLEMNDEEFLGEIQAIIGNRLGKFVKAGKRQSYPLQLTRAKQQVMSRLVLVGNAVHTLHPVAGQGFNLGLRDIAVLAEVLADAIDQGLDLGDSSVLEKYAARRTRDHRMIIGFTHSLVKVFSNNTPPIAQVRNLGLLVTDLIPGLKHVLARNTMGLAGRLPRIARGLSGQK